MDHGAHSLLLRAQPKVRREHGRFYGQPVVVAAAGQPSVGAVGGERPMSSSRFRPRRRRRHVRARGSGGPCGAHDSGTGLADALVLGATVFCRGGCRASRAARTCSRCSARYTMKPHMQLVCQGFQERMMQIFDLIL